MFINKHICNVYTWIGNYTNKPKTLCNLIIWDGFKAVVQVGENISAWSGNRISFCRHFTSGSNSPFIKQLGLLHNAGLGANRINNVHDVPFLTLWANMHFVPNVELNHFVPFNYFATLLNLFSQLFFLLYIVCFVYTLSVYDSGKLSKQDELVLNTFYYLPL